MNDKLRSRYLSVLASLLVVGLLLPQVLVAQETPSLDGLSRADDAGISLGVEKHDFTGQEFRARPLPEFHGFLESVNDPRSKEPIALWYRGYLDDYRAAAKSLSKVGNFDRKELAEQTFETFLGQTDWTAGRNRKAVLSTLRWLSDQAKNSSLSTADLRAYSGMKKALLREIAEESKADGRGARFRKDLAAGREPEEGWTEDTLRKAGVDLWDYMRAATLLMGWMEARDQLLASGSLAEIISNAPEPEPPGLTDTEISAWMDRVELVTVDDPSKDDAVKEAGLAAESLRDAQGAQAEAMEAVSTLLGASPVDSVELSRLSRRYLKRNSKDPAAPKRLEETLLNLRHANAEHRRVVGVFRDAVTRAAPPGSPVGGPSVSRTAETSSGGIFDPLDPDSVPSRVRRQILKSDFRAKIKLLDLDIAEGIGISARYRWEIDSNIDDKYWTRVDTWELKGDVRIGDIIRDWVDLPLHFNIDAGRKLIVARQFPSMKKAALAVPKTPLNIPVNAEKAAKLTVGDFFSIPAELSFATGAGYEYSALTPLAAGGGVSYVVHGRFRIQVFKTDEHHVRLRLVGLRSHGPSVSGRVKLGIDIFGIRLLDKAVERLLGSSPLRVGVSRQRGGAFSADYIFDLRNEDARKAYDKIMKKSLLTGEILAASALFAKDRLQERMLSDLRPAEDIFHMDKGLPEADRRVNRIFKGSASFKRKSRDFRIGIKLLQFDRRSSYVENRLNVYDDDEKISRYLFPVHTRLNRWSALFGLLKEDREFKAYALVPMSDEGKALQVQDVVFATSMRDKKASSGEVRDAQLEFLSILGPALSDRLFMAEFPNGRAERFNTQITVSFHRPAVVRILDPEQTTEDQIWQAVTRILDDFDLYRSSRNDDDFGHRDRPWEYRHWSEAKQKAFDATRAKWGDTARRVDSLVEQLLELQRGTGDEEHRAKEFLNLVGNELFRTIGVRLLIELIGQEDISRDLFVAVGANLKGRPNYQAQVGEDSFKELYALVNEALYNLDDRDR